MKRLFIILTLFIFFINCSAFAAASKIAKKVMVVVTDDSFRINAQLMYPNIKTQTEFKTVVLLHSLGYTSDWWGTLPEDLLSRGYAVLTIDLRGHGKSVYNSKLVRVSWKSMTNKAFAKYPNDVITVMNKIKTDNPKKVFFNDWAVVGADLGAVTAVIASNKFDTKPKTLVMISPLVAAKSLYTPVNLAELGKVDILAICGINDTASINARDYLSKFAQAAFVEYNSESKASGMLMFKSDPSLIPFIISWISQYFEI